MAASLSLTLDTTGPSGVTVSIDAGAAFAATQNVTLTIVSADPDTTQMKVWGSVDAANDANVQATEGASAWIAFAGTKTIKLSAGDGSKTINVKTRDDVLNESSAAVDTITLDTTVPVVTVGAPDASKISEQAGKRLSTFTFTSDTDFTAWQVRVVPATGSIVTAGTAIGATNGSVVSGGAGTAGVAKTVTVDGRDLKVASPGDGAKIVKVFVQEASGSWSI